MKRYLRPATWLFLGVWLVLMFGGRSRFFQDPGTFWHVAVGDRLLQVGFFDTDPFTFTFHGKPWIPHQWLGEFLMSILHGIGGFDALLLGTVTLVAAVFTGIGLRLLHAGFHPTVVAVFIALGLAASSGHFHVRPHLATIAGMAVAMIYVTDFENGRIPLRRLYWLIPIIWVWSNIHGGALGGIATLALAIFGWAVKRRVGAESPIQEWRDLAKLSFIWLGCVAVCFVNPFFYRLPLSWIEIYEMSSLPGIIQEHRPIQFNDWTGLAVLGLGLLYGVLLFAAPIRQFRIVWLLPLVWFALACMRVRHAPLFSVVALIAIADLFSKTWIAALLVNRKSDLFQPVKDAAPPTAREEAMPFVIPAGIVALALLIQALGISIPLLGRGWAHLNPKIWPLEVLPELRDHQNDRKGGTSIFCEYAYGGFIIYYAPHYLVFIDDRCELFGDDFLTQFVAAKAGLEVRVYEHPAEPFAEWQAKYGSFDMALVATGGGFDEALSALPNAWQMVKQTNTATLYQKVGGPK